MTSLLVSVQKLALATKITGFVLVSFVLFGCERNNKPVREYESETLRIEKVTDNVYQHVSYLQTESYGNVPCNGMIYLNDGEAIVFDTPTDDKASAELIEWLGGTSIKAVVVSHFHVDCLGGLEAFHKNGIESYATNQTIKLAEETGVTTLPQRGFEDKYDFKVGAKQVIARYFGPGHTSDNIVGFVPDEKALFGGCLVKALDASKGNLADANTDNWSATVRKIKKAWPDIEHVIPGHGKNGGAELLEYTVQLFDSGTFLSH